MPEAGPRGNCNRKLAGCGRNLARESRTMQFGTSCADALRRSVIAQLGRPRSLLLIRIAKPAWDRLASPDMPAPDMPPLPAASAIRIFQ